MADENDRVKIGRCPGIDESPEIPEGGETALVSAAYHLRNERERSGLGKKHWLSDLLDGDDDHTAPNPFDDEGYI